MSRINQPSDKKMKFWGVSCVGGKAYKQVVNYRFYLTMAVLDPKSYDPRARDHTVTLSVIQRGQIFLLCVLKHCEIQQVNLNLIFDKGDDVTFTVGGYGTIHLTGYQLIDSDTDNQCYCPVVEFESEKQIHKSLGTKEKAKSKLSSKALMGEVDDDDDEEDEDSDYSAESEEIEESEESDENLEDEEDEIPEDEIKYIQQDVKEPLIPSKSSQKRKAKMMSLSEKRMKKENIDPESDEKSKMSPEGNEYASSEDGLDSSIGHTPMPKKLESTGNAKKKSKKKKRLSDISMIDKSQKDDDGTCQNVMTPKNKGVKPVVKLEGGVEYQDSVIGRGPIATQGKVVSVFYVGRLEDKTIFDARTAPKKPFTFKLGVPEVIRGLDIGVQGMRVGGTRKLKIPPSMGYGTKGINGVPPNSTLFFTIELIHVN